MDKAYDAWHPRWFGARYMMLDGEENPPKGAVGWRWRFTLGVWWRVCDYCETVMWEGGKFCRRAAEALIAGQKIPPFDVSSCNDRCCDEAFEVK